MRGGIFPWQQGLEDIARTREERSGQDVTRFAPMWVNAHGQPCSTPDRHVDPSCPSYRLEKPREFEQGDRILNFQQ